MKAVVISAVSSQLNHLACELACRGCLETYVHSYININRHWEKNLRQVSVIGPKIGRALDRRPLPEGLEASLIQQPVAALEFLVASLGRILPPRSPFLYYLRHIRGRALSKAGAKVVRAGADVVVAFHDTALEAFDQAETAGALRVLDFPSAHPDFTDILVREEAQRCPEFASSLVVSRPGFHVRRMKQEISAADFILVGSEYAKRTFALSGVPTDKVVAIPYGADTSRFRPLDHSSQHEGFGVLFAGRLEQLKGLSYLLEGYRSFRKKDTSLILAGSLPPDPSVLAPYQELYQFVGYVHHSEMPDFYRKGSVFVLPSLIEGFPLVVVEAMASGLPVIVTDTGAADIVRDGVDGFVVPIRDSDAISHCLEILYADAPLRHRMGESARQRALEFTWDRYRTAAADFLEFRARSNISRPASCQLHSTEGIG